MRTLTLRSVLGLALAVLVGCSPNVEPPTTPSPAASPATSVASLPAPTVVSSPPATSSESGIDGRTVVDGGCPVETEQSPCPARPISARLSVVGADAGIVVAATTSGADGRFRVPLAAGRYVLHAVNLTGAPFPRSSPVNVVIGSGRYTTLTVSFDSGIQ